jgi:hypothetical protein
MIRPAKKQAINLVSENAPHYVELFRDFQAMDGGWLIWPQKFLLIKKNLNLDHYVIHYRSDTSIDACLTIAMVGKESFELWNQELHSLPESEQQKAIEELTEELKDFDESDFEAVFGKWPETYEEEQLAKAKFESLSEEEKKENNIRAAFLFAHIFASIHNYLALMVLGEKMTSLVPKAEKGDDNAFLRAIKIDRNLLTSHPYFTERYKQAQANGSKEEHFLKQIATHQSVPSLKSRIRYPGLYVVFAMLQSLRWLDDLTHSEILDICDRAGLDRWQNRIEDVNYLTKRLIEFRRYQSTAGLSMHST